MWSPLSAVTGCTDERETDDLEKAKREVIAFRARVKELNNQIKDERQKAAERIRTLENKANGDIISGVPEKAQRGRSADLNSVASDEIIGLRKKIDQLMLIKAASEFRILELEGKAKKYKSKLSTLLRERNDNMSTAGSIISKESKMLLSSSGKQLVPPPPMTSMLMKEEMEEDDDDEVIKPTVGKDGLDTEAEVATLVLSRIRQLDGEIDDIRAALANVLDERDDYRKMKAELEYARDQMETRIPQLEEDLVNCNMQLDRERVTVANMRKMILAEKAAVAKAQLGYDEVALKLEENNKMFQRFKNERDEFADETSALEETLSQLRSQTTATKAGGKVEEGKLTQQLMMVLEEKERVQTERSMLLSELKASKDEIKSVSSITADLGRQLVEREADLTALKGENERLAVACSTVQSATEIAQKELLMLKAKVTTTEIAHSKNSSSSSSKPQSTATLIGREETTALAQSARLKTELANLRQENTTLQQRYDKAASEKKSIETLLSEAERKQQAAVAATAQLKLLQSTIKNPNSSSVGMDVRPPPPPSVTSGLGAQI